jgi:phosphonopyruvate decarboxylase
MTRLQALQHIVATLADEPVVVNLGHSAYELFAVGDRPLNFYAWGSMGLVSSVALGLALARPDRRVVALDGDGSLLMNLGSLATIAACAPPNLLLIVLDNGQYATTGGQSTATGRRADLEAAGRAMGIGRARTVDDLAGLDALLAESRSTAGPWLAIAKIAESAPTMKPPLDCVYIKHRFMEALSGGEGATRGTTQQP